MTSPMRDVVTPPLTSPSAATTAKTTNTRTPCTPGTSVSSGSESASSAEDHRTVDRMLCCDSPITPTPVRRKGKGIPATPDSGNRNSGNALVIDLTDPPTPATPAQPQALVATPPTTPASASPSTTNPFLARAKQVFKATGPIRSRSRSRSRSASVQLSSTRSRSVLPATPSPNAVNPEAETVERLPKMEDDLCTTTTLVGPSGSGGEGSDDICIVGVVKAESASDAVPLAPPSTSTAGNAAGTMPPPPSNVLTPVGRQRTGTATPSPRTRATLTPTPGRLVRGPISHRTPTPQLPPAVLGRIGRAQSLMPYTRAGSVRRDVAMHQPRPRAAAEADVVMRDAVPRTPPTPTANVGNPVAVHIDSSDEDEGDSDAESIVVTGEHSASTPTSSSSNTRRKASNGRNKTQRPSNPPTASGSDPVKVNFGLANSHSGYSTEFNHNTMCLLTPQAFESAKFELQKWLTKHLPNPPLPRPNTQN